MRRIAIHSVPRSGSSWLGEIFNSNPKVKYCFQPLFSYRFKDFLTADSSYDDLNFFFDLLSQTDDEFVCQFGARAKGFLPKFEKSDIASSVVYKEVRYHHLIEHLCNLDQDLKMVLLVRDPIEVINSWINAPKEFHPSWDLQEELFTAGLKNQGKKENFYGLNAWISITMLFEYLAETYPNQVNLIRYSDLTKDPIRIVKNLFEFCALDYSQSTEIFLQESIEKRVEGTYSVFKGKHRAPLNVTPDLVEIIKQKTMDAGLAHHLVG
jgi:hypothetical protein